jgi:nuclear transport factor 2 (NTF2) superfamily protein
MTMPALKTVSDRNPRTADEARAFVKLVEQLFMPWNVDAIVDGFTDDCVVKFGSLAPFRGREPLRQFFLARSARQRGYRLTKEFRALTGDMIANYWEGSWEDAESGMRMIGRGVETWLMRDGKIAVWEAAFNVSPADRPGTVADALR